MYTVSIYYTCLIFLAHSIFILLLCRIFLQTTTTTTSLYTLNINVLISATVAPETVKISVEPAELKPGMVATLHCDSSSSNPPAELSWWREGIAIPSANITETKPGLWFGTVSHAMLKVNVTQEMNGIMYTCQSHNEALQRSVHEAINLQVLCKCFLFRIFSQVF